MGLRRGIPGKAMDSGTDSPGTSGVRRSNFEGKMAEVLGLGFRV